MGALALHGGARLPVFEAPPADYAWLCTRVEHSPSPVFRALEVRSPRGQILGMVGYDGWTKGSVQMMCAFDSLASCRSLLRFGFHYPFVQQGRSSATAWVSERNKRSLALGARLGFEPVYRLKDGHSAGIDLLLLEARRETCRFLEID